MRPESGSTARKGNRHYALWCLIGLVMFVLASCGRGDTIPTPIPHIEATPTPTQPPAPTPTAVPPQPDPIAAMVNGVPIYVAEYHFSLWARVSDFRRETLEDALYEQRTLVKLLCMRVTLHVVPSDEAAFFHQAFPFDFLERPTPPQFRGGGLLLGAGLCKEKEAEALLEDLHRRVFDDHPSPLVALRAVIPRGGEGAPGDAGRDSAEAEPEELQLPEE